tara:strand:- start:2241 stop:2555 length:315 start_codon:yes stop_codon:yes gene_type:complete
MLGNGPFSATGLGTDSGATATMAADTYQRFVVTNISGHVDADSVLTIESPASTVLWESKIDVSVEGFSFDFNPCIPTVAVNTAILGKLASSSADCQVTISGYVL